VSFLRLVAAVLSAAGIAHARPATAVPAHPRVDRYLVAQIRHHRRETWRWQRLAGVRRTPAAAAEHDPSHAYRRWVRNLWRRRAVVARRRATNPPHRGEWICIHGHEGAWNDPNAPYYGGLQMDLAFQRAWGPELLARKGTADHWTPLEQMWVAERAYRSGLGFTPWPNTARMCGLL
jgi:hypothetical protein